MAPLSLKIVQDNGAVTRKVKLDPNLTVAEATAIVKGKANLPSDARAYALFLRSPDNEITGIWMEDDRKLSYYALRDGETLDFMSKIRNLRLRMLDGHVKVLQVDQSQLVRDLMVSICSKIGITNHEEYGMCIEQETEAEEGKENQSGTLTLKKKSQLKERDLEFEQLSKKLKTDDNVEWVDPHKSLSEACIYPSMTLLLKRRLFYSDRNVDSRDPVQLSLLYVQARDNILQDRHPVTEDKARKCKQRWANIRDMMRRKIRDRLRFPEHSSKNYRYEEELTFMIPYFKEGKETNDSSDYYPDIFEDNNEEEIAEIYVDDTLNLDDDEVKPILKFRKRKRVASNSRDFESTSYQELNTADPLDVFLMSIGSTLRKFSPYYLNQAKSKIFHVVQDYELEQLVKDNQVPTSAGNTR